ncbi:MAG: hypothetical protein ACLQJ0_04910 [Steroidobacteraceae bacterium]
MKLEASSPATLGAVVEAVTRLSTYSEAQILELVSAGKIKDLFPFRPTRPDELLPDTVDEGDLVEASAMPLSREQRAALIQSSLPATATARSVATGTSRVRRSSKKTTSKR